MNCDLCGKKKDIEDGGLVGKRVYICDDCHRKITRFVLDLIDQAVQPRVCAACQEAIK